MDFVTRDQMRAMDRRTIDGGIVPGPVLMERAGRGIYLSIVRRLQDRVPGRVVVVSGKGNNGGDGFVVARLLRERGWWPRVLLTVRESDLAGDALGAAGRARSVGLLLEAAGPRELGLLSNLGPADLIVDALLGTGLSGPAAGPTLEWIRAINASPAQKVAVDIPSGLSADRGMLAGEAVRADWTVTMALPKIGILFFPARDFVGDVDVVDIGIPPEVQAEIGAAARLTDAEEARLRLPRPGSGSHKGDWGKLLIVGGSPGLTGAPTLAGQAALRTGAGLVRVGIPQSLNPILETKLTEAMTIPLPDGEEGQLLASGADRILGGFGDWDALVLGPGLGRSPEAERLVMRLLGGWKGPLLIDADGLNALAAWGPDSWVPPARERRAGGRRGGCVLTPHPGEMSRLTGRTIAALIEDPVATAREWAPRWGVTLVLKGAPSVIVSADGEVRINPTGNSGLATGGSGDVLSGIIGALLGQGLSGFDAAVLGCYLHGLAADLAVLDSAKRSLLPGDLPEALKQAVLWTDRGQEPPGWRWRWVS